MSESNDAATRSPPPTSHKAARLITVGLLLFWALVTIGAQWIAVPASAVWDHARVHWKVERLWDGTR